MPWWYDRYAIEQTLKIRDQFNISTFIETGTFRGVNIFFHSHHFKYVYGVEIDEFYAQMSRYRVRHSENVIVFHMSSDAFLTKFISYYKMMGRTDTVFIYLDAHFHNPGAKTKEERWVVINEIKALRGFQNCVLVIHDFKLPNLGYLYYDNESLEFDLIKEDIQAINPDFHLYCNAREFCEVHTKDSIRGVMGINGDEDTLDTIKYHQKEDRLKYRGALYCTPEELSEDYGYRLARFN